ncbi:MAG: TetR/AcrR family transcriptional regulator [Arthrobacter sp.]|uniref:TetR/AcrR family transcriptional regulator n=1 Tax=unclassified Arthrobacter TaxID=235627 RepID=UPI00264F6A85|nr:TetR family transcriptional regulator [Micrococcaceae bacterium]MDN5812722.1 TetR family transcriptional regulator [Micrococcaceae bacterium]MDN5824988.1 TetR family transcriptional regulator [Micrococcaceae bacterium]MDN5880042.1 TetR family transcriptional regulator [Micrococcaceae bacterium]MDN5886973.1 TetR family transcriptional regulator [Micrococcaceae bacterium]
MRSIDGDVTTRARIRDAAITLFGRHGFSRTTVRDIASAAEVSPGLVIHYFGTKEGLRRACDTHVLETAHESATAKSQDPAKLRDALTEYLANPAAYERELAYIRRAVVEDSEAGDSLFDAYFSLTLQILQDGARAGTMRQVGDPEATAALMVTQSLGLLVLGRHVARGLGQQGFGVEAIDRLAVPAVDLYTHPLYTDSAFLDATREAATTLEEKDGHGPRH